MDETGSGGAEERGSGGNGGNGDNVGERGSGPAGGEAEPRPPAKAGAAAEKGARQHPLPEPSPVDDNGRKPL